MELIPSWSYHGLRFVHRRKPHHALDISFPSPDEISLQRGSVSVTQAKHVAIVSPDVVEDAFDVACRRIRDEAELSEHCSEDMSAQGRLNDIGPIQTVDAAATGSAPTLDRRSSAHFVRNTPFCSLIASP